MTKDMCSTTSTAVALLFFLSAVSPSYALALVQTQMAALTPVGTLCSYNSPGKSGLMSRWHELCEMKVPPIAKYLLQDKEHFAAAAQAHFEGLLAVYKAAQGLALHCHESSNDFQLREYLIEQPELWDIICRKDKKAERLTPAVNHFIDKTKNFLNNEEHPVPRLNWKTFKSFWFFVSDRLFASRKKPKTNGPQPEAVQLSEPALSLDAILILETDEVVRNEYLALIQDQKDLLEKGTDYGSFHPMSKLEYLDLIAAVEERWDIMYFRLHLIGVLNPKYLTQCGAFLESRGYLSVEQYQNNHKQAHKEMRDEAMTELVEWAKLDRPDDVVTVSKWAKQQQQQSTRTRVDERRSSLFGRKEASPPPRFPRFISKPINFWRRFRKSRSE